MSNEQYHYRECGLDNVYLLNGFRYSETPHGRVVHIEDIDNLHRVIGEHLVCEKKSLNGKERRFLRHELGLSQKVLGIALGKSSQSVARWEKDQTAKVDKSAERLLRFLYMEHIGENEGIMSLIRILSDLDDRIEGELSFEETEEGWQPHRATRPASRTRSDEAPPTAMGDGGVHGDHAAL